jgi:hypothetical protein
MPLGLHVPISSLRYLAIKLSAQWYRLIAPVMKNYWSWSSFSPNSRAIYHSGFYNIKGFTVGTSIVRTCRTQQVVKANPNKSSSGWSKQWALEHCVNIKIHSQPAVPLIYYTKDIKESFDRLVKKLRKIKALK